MTNVQSKPSIFHQIIQEIKKIEEEHKLAVWLDEQQDNYHPDILKSKGMLKNPECHKLFTEFITKYRDLL